MATALVSKDPYRHRPSGARWSPALRQMTIESAPPGDRSPMRWTELVCVRCGGRWDDLVIEGRPGPARCDECRSGSLSRLRAHLGRPLTRGAARDEEGVTVDDGRRHAMPQALRVGCWQHRLPVAGCPSCAAATARLADRRR